MQKIQVRSLDGEEPLGGGGGADGNLLQCSCLGNSLYIGTWWARVHRVTKSWTWLSDWACTQALYGSARWSPLSLSIYLETVNNCFILWIDEHSFISDVKLRQTLWATVKITSKIYVYTNFIPNGQKDKNEVQLVCPARESSSWKISPRNSGLEVQCNLCTRKPEGHRKHKSFCSLKAHRNLMCFVPQWRGINGKEAWVRLICLSLWNS